MARNFSLTSDATAVPLNAKDLKVGQELVRFIFPYWAANSSQPVQTSTWTITKILKTVVVVGKDGAEKRIKLAGPSYAGSVLEGRLTSDVQGAPKYSRASWDFSTTDDPKVAEIARTNEYRSDKRAALEVAVPAVDAVRGYGIDDPTKVSAAIEALQALLVVLNGESK